MRATLLSFWDTPETLTITKARRGKFLSDEIRCCIANQTNKYHFKFFELLYWTIVSVVNCYVS
jgi:hypothetical protein